MTATGGRKCGSMFANFVASTFKHDLVVRWPIPEGISEVPVDYDTGHIINEKKIKISNQKQIITEFFKKGNEPFQRNRSNIIDGGFSMGQDLLINSQSKDSENKKSSGSLLNSIESISSGDLY